MKTCPKRNLKALRRNNEGVTAVEFALIAPVLLLMVMGTTEVGLMMFAQNVMEGSAFSGSRTGKTGYVADGLTQEETIVQTINERAGVLMDTDNISVTSLTYSEFGDVGQPEPFVDTNGNGVRDYGENYTDVNGDGEYSDDMGIAGFGTGQEITMYTITYDWPIFSPLLQPIMGETKTLTAVTVVKNEPY